MADCVPRCVRKGVVARNVAHLQMKDVLITGYEGERVECERVDCFEEA